MDTVGVVKLTDHEQLKVAWKQLGILGKTFAIILLLLPIIPFVKISEFKEEKMAVAAPIAKRAIPMATTPPNAQPTVAPKVKSRNANVKKVFKKQAGAIAITPTPTNKGKQSSSSSNNSQSSISDQNNNAPSSSPTPTITPTIDNKTPTPTPEPTETPKERGDGTVGELLANVGELKLIPLLP